MNLKHIILIALAVMLVVALGRNPISANREKRDAWKKGKDPLIVSIEEHQKESKKNNRLGGALSGRYQNATPYDNGMTRQKYKTPAPNYYNPNNPGAYNKTPQGLQNPGNSYYPPPPEAGANQGGAGASNAGPRSERSPILDDGREVEISGTRIYTTDASGQKVPLKDGDYPIYGGRLTMYIRDGNRVAEPN